jgi:CheY-like chemotaxis protein
MRRNTILWADDDPDDLQMMRDIFAKNKKEFEIADVRNGKEAILFLEKMEEEKHFPCLIILDINMPVLDGKETLTLLKRDERFSKIPVVVFTTSASELDKLFCRKFGTEMVTKPPTFDNLEAAVLQLLDYCLI